jgi:hypothetical protein
MARPDAETRPWARAMNATAVFHSLEMMGPHGLSNAATEGFIQQQPELEPCVDHPWNNRKWQPTPPA